MRPGTGPAGAQAAGERSRTVAIEGQLQDLAADLGPSRVALYRSLAALEAAENLRPRMIAVIRRLSVLPYRSSRWAIRFGGCPLAASYRKITMRKIAITMALAGFAALFVGVGYAQHTHHGGHAKASVTDTRLLVHFPDELREHTLANMRDHLLALQEIQEALARKQEDKAARIAEERLGMTSLKSHGAHEVAKYMPQGMQDVGSEMHRSASRFAIEAQNAAVTGDLRPALEALSRVTSQCVGCHAGYRLK